MGKIQWKLPAKDYFYSHLNMEDITEADYTHIKRVHKNFKIKTFGENHDLYVQDDTLYLDNIFNGFWNMCSQIYGLNLDQAHFLSPLELAWQVALNKPQVKLDWLTDINMLLIPDLAVRENELLTLRSLSLNP